MNDISMTLSDNETIFKIQYALHVCGFVIKMNTIEKMYTLI